MSMTRGNAHQYLKKVYLTTKNDSYREALSVALTALRPVSREQAEKMRGEWIIEDVGNGDRRKKCSLCNQPISGWWGRDRFCANCGSPMTDEAVDMVMERLEELYEHNA